MDAYEVVLWVVTGLVCLCIMFGLTPYELAARLCSPFTRAASHAAPVKKPVDWSAIAELEHNLAGEHPDEWGPDTWVHDCTGGTGLYQACAARRVADQVMQARDQGGSVAEVAGLLEVRGALTLNEMREIERRFQQDYYRPGLFIHMPGEPQVTVHDARPGTLRRYHGSGWEPVGPAEYPSLFVTEQLE